MSTLMHVTPDLQGKQGITHIRGDVLEKSAATEWDFILLSSLLVRSQVDDLTAVEIAAVLVWLVAAASVEYA